MNWIDEIHKHTLRICDNFETLQIKLRDKKQWKEWVYKQTAMVNFVQNRGLFFTHGTHHQAINNHGTNKEDGRLTLTYFLQRKPFYY